MSANALRSSYFRVSGLKEVERPSMRYVVGISGSPSQNNDPSVAGSTGLWTTRRQCIRQGLRSWTHLVAGLNPGRQDRGSLRGPWRAMEGKRAPGTILGVSSKLPLDGRRCQPTSAGALLNELFEMISGLADRTLRGIRRDGRLLDSTPVPLGKFSLAPSEWTHQGLQIAPRVRPKADTPMRSRVTQANDQRCRVGRQIHLRPGVHLCLR